MTDTPATAAADDPALAGLPDRYRRPWRELFDETLAPVLRPGITILDVGGGRHPYIPPERRPPGTHYMGLDISAEEQEAAAPGSYEETHVGDIATRMPALEGRFDVVVSWQVLEHVRPLDAALENVRVYLRPGGLFVAQFSGRNSAFAVINLAVPHRVAKWIVGTFVGRTAVFPAHYDLCWYDAIAPAMRDWTEVAIVPRYRGARYFRAVRPLQKLYLVYEGWAERTGRRNLATHYLVRAVR